MMSNDLFKKLVDHEGGDEIVAIADLKPALASVESFLAKYSGGVNFNKAKLSDFDFQFYTRKDWNSPRTQLYCIFQSKTSGKTLDSDVLLWAGPRGDYWVICAELSSTL